MPYKRIVVGTDGSETAEKAVDEAIELASKLGAELEVVNAFKPVSAAELERMRAEIPDREFKFAAEPSVQSEHLLAKVVEKAERAGVKARRWSHGDDPANFLLDVAAETGADLIVVGNRGMTGMSRFLLGSVPNKVSHHAPCAVLIVRTQED